MSLRLAGAAYRYPGAARDAAADVDLEALPGTVTVLAGANGAGKSTVLGLCSGRLAPSRGTAEVDGKALAGLAPRALARVAAYLPQAERVPFDFTCLEFALFGTAPRVGVFGFPGAEDEARALAVLEGLGIADLAGRPVTEVSGGELQLARIARCAVQDSPWLLLDEPTAMLDPAHALAVGRAVRAAAAAGKGVLLSTHDLAFALRVADRAAVLKDGGMIAAGEPGAVLGTATLERAFGIGFELRPVPVPRASG